MKIIICLLLILPYLSQAQNVDFNKIILPDDITGPIELGERLVQIAWKNHPLNEISKKNVEISEIDLHKEKWSWLDHFTIAGNLNEYSINPPENRVVFYPRYNFGLRFSPYAFISSPANVNIAKNNLEIADLNLKNAKLALRKEVLTRYQDYLMNEKLFSIQNEITENQYAKFLLAEQKFKVGDVTLDEYNEALFIYNSNLSNKIRAENAYQVSKLALEEMIGMRLEDVQ